MSRRGPLPLLLLLLPVALLLAGPCLAQAPAGGDAEVDWQELALGFLAGLALFLFGVSQLSQGLRKAAGERMKALLYQATRSRLRGLATGVVATTILDSSSVTIILLIAMVDAALIGFVQALPVILGSNIGTTISSQVFALHLDDWAAVPLAGGLLLRATSRN